MGKVSNLRQFRKRKARETAAAKAAENRVRHGRSATQRKRDDEQSLIEKRRFEQHQRASEQDEE